MRRFMFGTRRRKVASIATALMLTVTGSAVAWAIYTGGTGTANGGFVTATNGGAAVTFSANGATACDKNATCNLTTKATNNAGVVEAILPAASQPGGALTFTSNPPECASHLSLNPSYAGQNIAANASNSTVDLTNLVKVDNTLPATCSAGTFTATLNLATNP
ncbi:MAG TPA: hypothetical protein VFA84_05400 [Acidimicrobiales bacterium]|nr:hypothetical protein [Acidimicrobiales bacterium]